MCPCLVRPQQPCPELQAAEGSQTCPKAASHLTPRPPPPRHCACFHDTIAFAVVLERGLSPLPSSDPSAHIQSFPSSHRAHSFLLTVSHYGNHCLIAQADYTITFSHANSIIKASNNNIGKIMTFPSSKYDLRAQQGAPTVPLGEGNVSSRHRSRGHVVTISLSFLGHP